MVKSLEKKKAWRLRGEVKGVVRESSTKRGVRRNPEGRRSERNDAPNAPQEEGGVGKARAVRFCLRWD